MPANTVTIALTGRQMQLLSDALETETRRLHSEVAKVADRDGAKAAAPENCHMAEVIKEHGPIAWEIAGALHDARNQSALDGLGPVEPVTPNYPKLLERAMEQYPS